MGIDIDREDCFILSDGPDRVGKTYRQLLDCINRGRKSALGETVWLESCLLEGGKGTSVEAFFRFRRRLNDLEAMDAGM